ncbi:MAG: RNA polymerase sigma factor, partial [Actinomyces sp.]
MDLTARLADDVDGAFADLVATTRARLHGGLHRLHPDRADDLCQETYVRAYRALSSWPPARIRAVKLEPWLWTIAMNLGRNELRDAARRPVPVPVDDHPRYQAVHHDPEPADTAAWDRRLAALPPRRREAVVLRHVAGLGCAEIA